MSVLCIDLISLARPNFHSTSDCCCKGYHSWWVPARCQTAAGDHLDPLVGVAHHSNEKVDQDHSGHQHVQPEHQLEEVGEICRVAGSHVHVFVTETITSHLSFSQRGNTYVLIPNREKKSFILTWTGSFQPEQKFMHFRVSYQLYEMSAGKTRRC